MGEFSDESDGSGGNPPSSKRGKKRDEPSNDDGLSEEDKKAERRAANRRSAFQSRQRRKILIEDLQRTVAALSKDNTELRKSNDEMRVKLEATMLENHQLRMQQQLSSNGVGATTSAGMFQGGSNAPYRGTGGNQQQNALAQLLAQGMGSGGGGDNDPLLGVRLALAAAHGRQGDQGQSQNTANNAAASGGGGAGGAAGLQASGLQSLLESAARSSGQGGGLQALLESVARASSAGAGGQAGAGTQTVTATQAGAGAQQVPAGLHSLLNSARAGASGTGGQASAAAALSEIQRAMLQGTGHAGLPQDLNQAHNLGGSNQNNQANNQDINEAIRNFLQKNNNNQNP
jgi:hypothetical protein